MPRKWQTVLKHVKPQGQARPRAVSVNGKARVFKPKKDLGMEALIQVLVVDRDPPKFDGPIKLTLDFVLKRPKSVPVKKRKYPTVKPDLSNMIKLVEDACNGILYDDDKQIVNLVSTKRYGGDDEISIKVEKVN